jgi:hypothetical protein
MDHWGDDPWADNNNSPPKQEITTPRPQQSTFTPAPVLLDGFLDDAQWGGNEDEGFSAWASSPKKPQVAASEPRVHGIDAIKAWEDTVEQEKNGVHGEEKEDGELPVRREWSLIEEDVGEPKEGDNVVSETSDSTTTIQPDDAPAPLAEASTEPLHPDDDLSTRSSTSPSDGSHHGAPADSPRTSFEEERANEKVGPGFVEQIEIKPEEEDEIPASARTQAESGDLGRVVGDVKDEPEGSLEQLVESPLQQVDKTTTSPTQDGANESVSALPSRTAEQHSDRDLISQLFPSTRSVQDWKEAPDDPVHSTSTRKAWYRLSRKQTMREYNSGNVDDNYIRVTWKTSHIRSDVIKTVSRWATEDRMAGRGPGARASFYWDTPAPSNQQDPFHSRTKSTISASNPTIPSLATDVPAAFNWSSPSVEQDVWKDATIDARTVSSPVAPPKHSTVAKLQRQEGRRASVDLSPRPKQPTSHKRTSTNVEKFKEITPASSFSPVETSKPPAAIMSDPWASLNALDTTSSPMQAPPTAEENDDDDWGEMVESSAVSSAKTPIAIASITEFAEPTTRNDTPSTPSSTPKSAKVSPPQPLPPSSGSRHASPIVRLKGTVSPTSALFKPSVFVPASVENGPIGPGLLKARNRSTESTPEKSRVPLQQVAQLDEVLNLSLPNTALEEVPIDTTTMTGDNNDDDFSAFEGSLSPSHRDPSSASPPPPTTPPLPIQQPTSNWADAGANLSIFDSVAPSPTSAPKPTSSHQPDPTDPWSIFDTPAPAPAPAPFQPSDPQLPSTRTPPRPVTPPKQPLTSATSSAQRRKADEDDLVRSIVEGLPDLSYMLRR